eukprot:GHVU01021758.1.p1 GENE.GHVU01021758.1~~GHVU01021758.1.p1  ORF type:complete len:159 (-),score=1.56 GHVU01021758.1:40-516(-)
MSSGNPSVRQATLVSLFAVHRACEWQPLRGRPTLTTLRDASVPTQVAERCRRGEEGHPPTSHREPSHGIELSNFQALWDGLGPLSCRGHSLLLDSLTRSPSFIWVGTVLSSVVNGVPLAAHSWGTEATLWILIARHGVRETLEGEAKMRNGVPACLPE